MLNDKLASRNILKMIIDTNKQEVASIMKEKKFLTSTLCYDILINCGRYDCLLFLLK